MRRRVALLGITAAALAPASVATTVLAPGLAQAATTTSLVVDARPLDNATVGTSTVASVVGAGVSSVRWSLDSGDYVTDSVAPFEFPLTLQVGDHRLRARVMVDGDETRLDAKFAVAASSAPAAPVGTPAPVVTTPAPAPTTPPVTPAPTAPAPVVTTPAPTLPPVPAGARVVRVGSATALVAALADARPGDVIELADGTYQAKDQL